MGDWVGRKEAARLLGVTVRTLSLWTRQGLLAPRFIGNRKEQHYRVTDLQMLRLARSDKSTDIWHVKALALQALSAAKTAELRLQEVFEHLGLDIPPLARDTASVQALYAEAGEVPTPEQLLDPVWVRFWGGAFFGVDETYLELVGLTETEDEPWRRFMSFANEVLRTALRPGGHVEEAVRASDTLRLAYRYFQGGKQHLWYTGYMYCRRSFGRRIADVAFDGSHSAVEELMAILH
jgi:PAS domain-containing protein